MNHKFYSVNVSNTINKRQESFSLPGFILEKDLKEIYETQYNDLFPKIVSKTKSEFLSLLKEQVLLHLKIINKKMPNSLSSKYVEIFSKKYFTDKTKVTKGVEELIKNPDLQQHYLNILNCFIHCHKCSTILHKCKNKLIYYKNYLYCLNCQKVYNENQIKLYCQECKTCYYTKIRYMINKRYEHFYPVSFKDYHCPLEEQEKIKCLECGHDLYYNITYENKNKRKNTIREVFCLKCKLLYDLNEIYFKCKICKSDFKSEAQIYSSFSFLKIQFLIIMHSLRKKKLAIPEININRKCKCNISKYDKYLHEDDNGVLYLGNNLEGQYVIVCDGCYSIFKYNEFLWNCPLCGINFKSKKIMSEIKKDKTMFISRNNKNEKKDNRQIMFKSPSHIYMSKKNNIEKGATSAGNTKINSNNIVKNIFVRSNTKNNMNDSNNKTNHNTKVILLTNNNINSERKKKLYLSDQKANLFKKLNIKNNNNNYFNSINYNGQETELKKLNIKNKNNTKNNTLNSLINNISFSNNKSDSNSNKCTDSTANITYRNYDGIYEKKGELNTNNVCRCPSCLLEDEYRKKFYIGNITNNNNYNKVNRKLVYDDFADKVKENKIIYEKKNKKIIKKSKTCMGKDNIKKNKNYMENEKIDNKKEINNNIKRTESGDSLMKNKENKNINELKKQSQFCKTAKKLNSNDKFVVLLKRDRIIENSDGKKINLSLFNSIIKDNNTIESIDSNKNLKSESNLNNVRNHNSQNKINNIKNVKSLNLNEKAYNFQNGIKNLNRVKYINSNYYSCNGIFNKTKELLKMNEIKEINRNNSKEKIEKEKKQVFKKPPSKFNSQNKDLFNNIKSNNNLNKKQNENQNKNQNLNSIFNKIKQYYQECINEEENLYDNAKKNINKENKSKVNSEKKQIHYNTNFNSDNYSILKLLGRGTYGKTYLVEEIKTKERYALKKILINDKIELKENQDEYNLILKLLKEYPDLKIINIYGIEIKDLDKYNTVMYVLMEAANCDWEKEIINRCSKNYFYKEDQLMKLLIDLVKTFSILQKNGICHRDVKPQNILCFANGGYKISDFGEAKNIKKNFVNKKFKNNYAYEDNTMKQTLRGTELYMSPILFHALRTQPYQLVKYNSYKSDVYSLGMCLFLASCLDYEGLYEIREITNNPKKTKFVVNRYLSIKYSQKYINLLISMLQINEADRPDFIELEKMIEKLEN